MAKSKNNTVTAKGHFYTIFTPRNSDNIQFVTDFVKVEARPIPHVKRWSMNGVEYPSKAALIRAFEAAN